MTGCMDDRGVTEGSKAGVMGWIYDEGITGGRVEVTEWKITG